MRILDLFCGAGGAAMGYHRAGFEVVGVDIRRQPHYPFPVIQADALTFPLDGFDAIHASPPCQEYAALHALYPEKRYPDLVAPTRQRLLVSGVPWVMENVATRRVPFTHWIMLCGGMFGLRTYRHRRFESSWLMFQPPHPRHVRAPTRAGGLSPWRQGLHVTVTGNIGIYMGQEAMGIDWMTGDELSQAIPPAYTEWIGRQLLAVLDRAA